MNIQLKPYKKNFDYSYAFGAFAAYEAILARPGDVSVVYIHSDFNDSGKLSAVCVEKGIKTVTNDRIFNRVGQKENSLVFAVFKKYTCGLSRQKPHICLVNPGDMGNLGCIIRTAAAFGIYDLALITPAADIFDPKTIRASMGAVFRVDFGMFASFDEYLEAFAGRVLYPFMTDGAALLGTDEVERPAGPYSLIFGNEAAGLPASFHTAGKSVRIPQTGTVDSLNLSVAAGIGLYEFTKVIS
ncbi:MAG: TrmH family RNA methyltransferase [Defluviitaleaceae bacterium]|nr:TrmH family RNA methyltransferase [Defluviitaleaceae bacterium]MCL2837375.1 TrmH family RNA methyltransferase [Defluviitaleaceae bacterium]